MSEEAIRNAEKLIQYLQKENDRLRADFLSEVERRAGTSVEMMRHIAGRDWIEMPEAGSLAAHTMAQWLRRILGEKP